MMTARVAVLQMTSQPDLEANWAQVFDAAARAQQLDCHLLVLPENVLWMGRPLQPGMRELEPVASGDVLRRFETLARQCRLAIVAGTLPIAACGQRFFARCHVFDPDQGLLSWYDKMHLFDVDLPGQGGAYRESDTYQPGDRLCQARVGGLSLGIGVCYDLRFPEFFRAQRVDAFVIPAAFTATTGAAHWEALLRARAIENQTFVIAAGQCGTHADGRQTYGHSAIYDPWGVPLAVAADEPGLIWADLDLTQLTELQRRFPVHEHRRLR